MVLKVDDPFFDDEVFLVLVVVFLVEDDFPAAEWEVEVTFLEEDDALMDDFPVELDDFFTMLDFWVEVECLVLDEHFEEEVNDFGLVDVELLTLLDLMEEEDLTLLDLVEDEGWTLLD